MFEVLITGVGLFVFPLVVVAAIASALALIVRLFH